MPDNPDRPTEPPGPVVLGHLTGQPPMLDFATSITVLDSYRGRASGTAKSVGLKITLANDPDRIVVISMAPDTFAKLRADLERVAKRQADEDYGRG